MIFLVVIVALRILLYRRLRVSGRHRWYCRCGCRWCGRCLRLVHSVRGILAQHVDNQATARAREYLPCERLVPGSAEGLEHFLDGSGVAADEDGLLVRSYGELGVRI